MTSQWDSIFGTGGHTQTNSHDGHPEQIAQLEGESL